MKKHIKLLIEGLFDDIEDLFDEQSEFETMLNDT